MQAGRPAPPTIQIIGAEAELGAAVVSAAGGFEEDVVVEVGEGGGERVSVGDRAEIADRESVGLEPLALDDAVLNGLEDVGAGADGSELGGGVDGGDGDLFDLEGDDVG